MNIYAKDDSGKILWDIEILDRNNEHSVFASALKMHMEAGLKEMTFYKCVKCSVYRDIDDMSELGNKLVCNKCPTTKQNIVQNSVIHVGVTE